LINFRSVEELRERVKEIFVQEARKISYARGWIPKFVPVFLYLLYLQSALYLW